MFKFEELEAFTIVGFVKEIELGKGKEMCPKFWDEINKQYFSKLDDNSEISKFIKNNNIGEYAVCIDNMNDTHFIYMIGGLYKGGNIPNGLGLYTFNKSNWVKFTAKGPLPTALQMLNTYVWDLWMKKFDNYEVNGVASIEWYSEGNTSSINYESQIWIPIKRK